MASDMAEMLRDIRREMASTTGWVGKDQLDARVMAAMAAVPRHEFVPEEEQADAYRNGPLPIGHGQTISQPYIVALMTDLLAPAADQVVLEIGTGCGYQAAVLSRVVRQVYSVEVVPALAEAAAERLKALGYDNVRVRCGDGYQGWSEHAPYDGIIVTAAAPAIPSSLVAQLKPSGRMVIPVGPPYGSQTLCVVTRDTAGETHRREILPVAFVPMTRGEG